MLLELSRFASRSPWLLARTLLPSLAMSDRFILIHFFKNRLTYNPSCRVDGGIHLPDDPRLPIAPRLMDGPTVEAERA